MKKTLYRVLARINKWILPSYTKKGLDISRASKLQLAMIGWRAWVTLRAINQ